jgi:16S rRNA processing protein RimM
MLAEWNWTVGEVVAAFGIRGEMKVRIESDFPDRFARLTKVCLRPRTGAARLFEVQTSRLHKGQALLKLEGVDRIEDVDVWRGAKVQIKREEAVALPQDAYYVSDLVGMEIVTKDGRTLGPLEKVLPYPGHDIWQAGEALIPAVKQIVVSVDPAARKIVIDPPEGMLPDEAPEVVE